MATNIRSQGMKAPAKGVYGEMVALASRRSRSLVTCSKAFLVGGSICMLGEFLRQGMLSLGISKNDAGTWVSILLVFASALLTGLGLYEKLGKHGGAGTLIPVTGFANAVASAAVEAKTEGFILGVGTKIFTVAGPVILYGVAASTIYGIIYWLITR